MENTSSTAKKSSLPVISIVIGVLLLAGVGAYFALNSNTAQQGAQVSNEQPVIPSENTNETPTQQDTVVEQEGSVKTVEVSGKNFEFMPKEIRVKQGDTVKIVFNNTQGFHDFVVDEFNIKTSQINAPGTETVEFIADKKGTFEYYCSVGQHRQMGMVGTLIVE